MSSDLIDRINRKYGYAGDFGFEYGKSHRMVIGSSIIVFLMAALIIMAMVFKPKAVLKCDPPSEKDKQKLDWVKIIIFSSMFSMMVAYIVTSLMK